MEARMTQDRPASPKIERFLSPKTIPLCPLTLHRQEIGRLPA